MNNGMLTKRELEAIRWIRNFIVHQGFSPSVRDIMKAMGYGSPRSAALIISPLIDKGVFRRKKNGSLQLIKNVENAMHAQTIDVPLIGTVACGSPILAQENYEAIIPISLQLASPPYKHFLLRAKGDSMNLKGINDGDLVLIRQQSTAANGEMIVALIDDEATIKEFHSVGETIILKPRSKNKAHTPIILTQDFKIQGVVITAIPGDKI
jgi:repressor LexA